MDDLVHGDDCTGVEFAVVSQLADGADRIVVTAVLAQAKTRGKQARIEVVLPMPRDQYVREQGFSSDSKAEFDRFIDHPRAVRVAGPARSIAKKEKSLAYERAGRELISRCDVLLAIWDGKRSRGRGGTAETLLRAAAEGMPCIWLPSDGKMPGCDNLTIGTREFYEVIKGRAEVPGERVPPFRKDDLISIRGGPATLADRIIEIHDRMVGLEVVVAAGVRRLLGKTREPSELLGGVVSGLRTYNKEILSGDYLSDYNDRLERNEFCGGRNDWITPFSARASVLSELFQQRYRWHTRVVAVFVVGAAMMLALHVSVSSNAGFAWGEAAFLVASTVAIYRLHRLEIHRRWITYRVLAERLRSATVLGRMDVPFSRASTMRAVSLESDSSGWLLRAFDEVWQRRPHRAQPAQDRGGFESMGEVDESNALEEEVNFDATGQEAEAWISGQILYHKKNSRRHQAWCVVFEAVVLSLVGGAVISAGLDAMGIARPAMTFLLVVLPAGAASLGALLTVRQHRALWERSRTMVHRLYDPILDTRNAPTSKTLAIAGVDAATIMAEESEDWLGALWFLDLEHTA